MTAIHVADTGLFAALGAPSNERYRRVRSFALRNEIAFTLPERVYEELTVNVTDRAPIDVALENGWATIADPLDYTNPIVSRTMDGVRRYIANADDRPVDEIERADAALGGVAVQALSAGRASRAYVYTTDVAAGEGVETILADEGFDDSVTYVDGFRFVEDLVDGTRR